MRRTKRHCSTRAFTLLELVVVMTIASLLAGMAVMKLREPYLAAEFEASIRRIAAFDEIARNQAARGGVPISMTIDLEGKTLQIGNSQPRREGPSIRVSSAFEISRVITDAADIRKGQLSIPISGKGHSPTFAIRLRTDGDREAWLVFLGLTGQFVQLENEEQFNALRKTLWPQRLDID